MSGVGNQKKMGSEKPRKIGSRKPRVYEEKETKKNRK